MKVGDIVYLKHYVGILGEVKSISDADKVTITLCDTGMEITVDIADVAVTGSKQPHRKEKTTVNILGTTYKIIVIEQEDYRSNENTDGWCDSIAKEILIYNYVQSTESVKDLVAYQKRVLRHEIIHAFLYESGLHSNSCKADCWAKNEEMIDWLSIQEPKIHKAFKEADCAEESDYG